MVNVIEVSVLIVLLYTTNTYGGTQELVNLTAVTTAGPTKIDDKSSTTVLPTIVAEKTSSTTKAASTSPKINDTESNSKDLSSNSTGKHLGRENVPTGNQSNLEERLSNNTERHMGREHVITGIQSNLEERLSKQNSTTVKSVQQEINATVTKVLPPLNTKDESDMYAKKTVPRKGVKFEPEESSTKIISSTVTTSTTTTTTATPSTTKTTTRPRKPTVTIGSEDEPDLPNKTVVKTNNPLETHHTNTNYVVPIVAVILSVPLVAIVASVLYKRGSEWWQHRHYRRMDYLIDGMYNN